MEYHTEILQAGLHGQTPGLPWRDILNSIHLKGGGGDMLKE